MSLQEKIMEYMQTKAKRPMSPEDLLYALALEADEIKQLPSVMEELERKNLLIQNRSGLLALVCIYSIIFSCKLINLSSI